jgi:hypothetical protein
MKLFAICLIFFGFIYYADGQTHTPSSPMYLNHIYYILPDSLTALEQNTARMESKGREGDFIMDGEKSTLRIKAGDSIRFAVKIAMTMMDPSMMIKLYKFESKKGSRVAIVSNQGGKNNKKNSGYANEINFNVQKESDDFILIPAARLGPGEYGFLNMMLMNASSSGRSMSYTVFAFGVD